MLKKTESEVLGYVRLRIGSVGGLLCVSLFVECLQIGEFCFQDVVSILKLSCTYDVGPGFLRSKK
jgi:hypothetical protein